MQLVKKVSIGAVSVLMTGCAGLGYLPEYNADGSYKINPADFSLYEIASAAPNTMFGNTPAEIRYKEVWSGTASVQDAPESKPLDPSTLKSYSILDTLPRPDGEYSYRYINPSSCKSAYPLSVSKEKPCIQAVVAFNKREENEAIEAVQKERSRQRVEEAKPRQIAEAKKQEAQEAELERQREAEENRLKRLAELAVSNGYTGYRESFLSAYLELVEQGKDISGLYIEPDNWRDARVHVRRVDGNTAYLLYDDEGLRFRSSGGTRSSLDLPLIVIKTKEVMFEGKSLANYQDSMAFRFVDVSSTLTGRQTVVFEEVEKIR